MNSDEKHARWELPVTGYLTGEALTASRGLCLCCRRARAMVAHHYRDDVQGRERDRLIVEREQGGEAQAIPVMAVCHACHAWLENVEGRKDAETLRTRHVT